MSRVSTSDGRRGDVWRVRADAHEMFVSRLNEYTITLKSVAEPQHPGWGFELRDWEDVLYRIREDTSALTVGGTVHLYVPPTELYIVRISIDQRWPVLSGWVAYQIGQSPTPEIEDSGLFFNPSADENFDLELVFRPYPMLQSGTTVIDNDETEWRYERPFTFRGGAAEMTGVPCWPLDIPEQAGATEAINATSHDEQIALWEAHAQVRAGVFDLRATDEE